VEVVKVLLDEPTFDINSQISTGETALCLAACYGKIEIVRLLLARGADTKVIDWRGQDAIYYAKRRSTPRLAQAMIDLILEARKAQSTPSAAAAELLHKERGNAAFKQGRFAEALQEYTKAIEINQLNPILWGNRAAAHLVLGNNKETIEDCHRATKLDPNYVKAYYREARALFELGSLIGAKNMLQKALNLSPDDPTMNEFMDHIDYHINATAQAE
jgi:tetratricopeptide (TPR) repeat protein